MGIYAAGAFFATFTPVGILAIGAVVVAEAVVGGAIGVGFGKCIGTIRYIY